MESSRLSASSCRHCRHYVPQGRRGGDCTQLDVPVQGCWKACALAAPIFESDWNVQPIPIWQDAEVARTVPAIVQEVEEAARVEPVSALSEISA